MNAAKAIDPPLDLPSPMMRAGFILLAGIGGATVLFTSVLLAKDTTAAPLLLLGAPVVHAMALLRLASPLVAPALGALLYSGYALAFDAGLRWERPWWSIGAILAFHLLSIAALNLLPWLGVESI